MEDMKQTFTSNIDILLDKKANNTKVFTHEVYCRLISEVKAAKLKSKKEPLDYRRLARFDVIEINGSEKLIQPVGKEEQIILYYLIKDELFDVLHETHLSIGHGGRTRMLKELQRKYKNVTKEIIMTYLALCKPCQQKQSIPKKGLVSKPLMFKEFNSRCQVDLIDMQSNADGEYKYILNYQDHLTKLVFLRPLKTKTAAEVAYTLLDIFTIIGAPNVLQSDNGREFSNHVVNELTDMWPELKIVHGKPRHSQSQGSVERANQDVQNMMTTRLQSCNNSHWAEGLRFIQLMKNRAYHDGIRQSPYEALFGSKAKVGLSNSCLPKDVVDFLKTEEDLEKAEDDLHANLQDNNEQCAEQVIDDSREDTIQAINSEHVESIDETNNLTNIENTENVDEANNLTNNEISVEVDNVADTACIDVIRNKQKQIEIKRKHAHENLKVQATKMLKLSERKFPPISVGDTVRIRIPDVDRGRGDPRSILGVVLETHDEFYKIGTDKGTLKQLYCRSEVTLCPEKLISVDSVPNAEISLRQSSSAQSLTGGQGYTRCSCTQKCNSNRCKCKSKSLLCNSKCHRSTDCCNK